MPDIIDAFNDDHTRRGRFLNRAAHYFLWAVALNIVLSLLDYLGIHNWLTTIADNVVTLTVIIAIMHSYYTRLCVRCMDEVPADAALLAQRRRPLLKYLHTLRTPRGVVISIATIIAIGVVIKVFDLPRVVNLPIDAALTAYLYSVWLHHKVRPWCPYCRDWGEDGDIREPSPDPVVKATR